MPRKKPILHIEGLSAMPGYRLVPDDFGGPPVQVPINTPSAARKRESYAEALRYVKERDAKLQAAVEQRAAKANAIVQAKLEPTLRSNAKPGEQVLMRTESGREFILPNKDKPWRRI